MYSHCSTAPPLRRSKPSASRARRVAAAITTKSNQLGQFVMSRVRRRPRAHGSDRTAASASDSSPGVTTPPKSRRISVRALFNKGMVSSVIHTLALLAVLCYNAARVKSSVCTLALMYMWLNCGCSARIRSAYLTLLFEHTSHIRMLAQRPSRLPPHCDEQVRMSI